jgi:hypothetical protein
MMRHASARSARTARRAQSACRGTACGGSLAAIRWPSCAWMSIRAMAHRLARCGLKRWAWTDHVEVHTAHSARRGAASDDQRLDDPREDVHRKHPWTSVHLPDTVPGTESKREGRTTERRSSSARSMVPELNGGEGAGPSGRGAALGSGEALGPTHGKRGGVRWLGTNSVVGTEARRGGGNLPKADKKPRTWTTSNGVASSYKRTRSEGDGTARACRAVHDRAWIVGACTRGCRAHRGINQQKLVWR